MSGETEELIVRCIQVVFTAGLLAIIVGVCFIVLHFVIKYW